jgi:hypothetical protein
MIVAMKKFKERESILSKWLLKIPDINNLKNSQDRIDV